jgi:hypothetical protein
MDSGPFAVHVGTNVYCWDQEAQNRLLAECLGPLTEELRQDFGFTRFWFDRFDARGPHIVALFSVPLGADLIVAERLENRLLAYLAIHSRPGATLRKQVETRHESCLGMALCDVDSEPGIADENSYRIFWHSSWGYPYRLTRGLPPNVAAETWELIDELTRWTVAQIAMNPAESPVRKAVLWLASFERLLREMHPDAESYWKFHASTLLFGIPQQLEKDERQVYAGLDSAIRPNNERVFSALWEEDRRSGPCWPPLRDLIECVITQAEPPERSPWRLAREIVHWTLKQLCLYVASEIPLVLYAWRRNLLA